MTIEEVKEPDDEVLEALHRLVPQLSPGAALPSRDHLRRLLEQPGCTLLVARADGSPGEIVGALTLVSYPIPSGTRVWIEEVVVDEAGRGQGVGEALVRAALERARALGAEKVDLTSNPTRAAANRLYRRMGFEQRETNAYRMRLERG